MLETTPEPRLSPKGLETCGADNFMLRDAVCDEITNNAVCLYDGGDCCLEAKIRTQCKDCSCRKDIEPEKLMRQFDDLQIKPLHSMMSNDIEEQFQIPIANIEDVVSLQTCAIVCLDHTEKSGEINSWYYQADIRLCQCGWTRSSRCPETRVDDNWTLTDVEHMVAAGNFFIQLAKTLPCGNL